MNKLLVPIDFTEPTINALKFAINIANKSSHSIEVLHIIKSELNRKAAKIKLDKLITEQSIDGDISLDSSILVGDISRDISKVAELQKNNFIVMGTHGAKGLEKIFGTKAINVIRESKVPYITLQNEPKQMDLKKIAMTIDLEKESVQIVRAAGNIAKLFGAEVILVGGDHKDEGFKKKIAININTSRRLLKEMGVISKVELLPRDNFIRNFIEFCKINKVGIIAATYYPDTFTVFSSKFVQKLMENEAGIPVLTLDAQAVTKGTQYSFMSI